MEFVKILVMFVVLLAIPFSVAEYSIDISGLQSEEYLIGEDISFSVVLLENSIILSDQVEVVLHDALQKKEISKTVNSNENVGVLIGQDFRSGLWEITATYNEATVTRTFLIGENSQAEFVIEGDELIIKNNGNTRYTKTVQITIGEEVNSYVQNIGVGEEKRLKIVSPEGFYDIEVTDGKVTLKKENIELFGTGKVVGAIDPDLVGYTGFAGASDPSNIDDTVVSSEKYSLTMIFVGAVVIIAGLVFVERRLARGKFGKGKAKGRRK